MCAGKIEGLQKKHKILGALADKRVFILADNDEPGEEHALEVAQHLHGKAREIKIVRFPELEEKANASDFIELHGEKEAKGRLIERIAEALVWMHPKVYLTLQELCELPSEDHPPIIDKGIMPYNSHILLAGEGGVGKSLLRLEPAIHLAMGWDWMGFHIPRARTIGIFQYENSEHTEKSRVQRMLQGLGTNFRAVGDRIKYAKRDERYDLTLKDGRPKLLERVKGLNCEVIIYDCLSNLHNPNENDNIKMREVLDILTDINAELKTGCIVIHHFGKPGDLGIYTHYRVRGASSIMDWAYTVITLASTDGGRLTG